jgi:hypothetical protein
MSNFLCCECRSPVEPVRVAVGFRNCAACAAAFRARRARAERQYNSDHMPAARRNEWRQRSWR